MEKVIQIQHGKIVQLNQVVLDDVNLEVNSDELVFLIGKTGSGKSSLLKVLYGELALSSGSGKVAGFSVNDLDRRSIPQLRRAIGVVFQDFQLLTDRSVAENLYFVMRATGWKDKREMENRAKTVLSMVSLESKGNVQAHQLSGGEQQRVAIARALINHPKLILADEPTGNLDPETSAEIMKLIIAVSKEEKAAVLMATHDMAMIEKFPGRVIRVEDGKLKPLETMHRFDPFQPMFE
ncbi:MAG: phosphonate ABC transporter ATP-binding protein [Candidatus Fluviicola riflensis]|nr:MAG: phosphonate ABC transporter ATP-binding protein [Candidatus Fluviicola riflensis]OGS78192.1 MAG: phosphonate ABC transporter ATP-binding protein [Candidatus Fluviicola riflensis]OGS85258.1 MAG: phosphonate ABC transporter ATP-binding protein [Fluviicola sp. RIFCSPHIGHO2_01_FULL_43_53]OGS87300.1 MAG: phosphonate ABC transporter ATP-binding protein [Fluviicola sp. RIFCSPHIGHO2_12_FULL_43_24]